MQAELGPEFWIGAVAVFVGAAYYGWNIWKKHSEEVRRKHERQRIRLGLSLRELEYGPDGRSVLFVPLSISNLGHEPAIIESVELRGPNLKYLPGERTEPRAGRGSYDRVLPKRLEPGHTIELMLFAAIDFTDDVNELVVIDNDGNEFALGQNWIRHVQKLVKVWHPGTVV